MLRLLTADDSFALRDLRLLSLQTDPLSFISTFDCEKNYSAFYFADKIRYNTRPPVFGYYGYFADDQLTAYVELAPDYLAKANHLAYLYELYVHPDHRHGGIAKNLLDHAIKQIKTLPHVEQLHLRVNSTNASAIKLYKKLGFKHIATRKKAIKENDGTYQDELMYCLCLR